MKTIDHDNWLRADLHGQERNDDARKWREAFLSVHLDSAVPSEIADLFEAARGGMLYGYFFQPLMAMALEQCYRVLEVGARARCELAGLVVTCADGNGRRHPLSFSHNLRALAKLELISDTDLPLWYQARELRDWVAAPEHQSLLTREHGVTALARAAALLGRLYRSREDTGEPVIPGKRPVAAGAPRYTP